MAINFKGFYRPSFLTATVFFLFFFSLGACKTFTPVPRVYATWALPSVIDKAQEALKEGNLSRSAVLLLNNHEASPQKEDVEKNLVQALREAEGKAEKEGRSLDYEDARRTLKLFQSDQGEASKDYLPYDRSVANSWPPVPAPETSASGPESWLKGTVTVMVNRGLRMMNGAAVPDIVLGSGFFITSDGYLLTNHHVIESLVDPSYKGYAKLTIKLPNSRGESLPAKVVSWDINHDLALLKVEYQPPFVFRFSDGPTLIPGQKVIALGSPGGLDATVTQGIVSATRRPLLPMGDVIQVDVAVNPGNSGGPLVNEKGEVVGIVFAGIQQFQGVNFAIPGEVVYRLLPRLKAATGSVSLPWVGAGLIEDMRGLEVSYVTPESPSDWSGLKVGDQVTAFAGVKVNDIASIQNMVLSFGLNAVVPIDVTRGDKAIRLWCTFEQRPELPLEVIVKKDLISNILPLAFGFTVEDIGNPVDQSFRVVKVFSGSAGDDLGLSPGDPVVVKDSVIDKENKAFILLLDIKKRLGGYLESVVQLGSPLTARQMI